MTYHKKANDPLRDKTLRFAIRIVRLNKFLTEQKKEFVVSRQVTKSGTNPGAMVREAANAESSLDFIHKLAIAQKEIGETQYWLELLYQTEYLSETEFNSLHADTEEILKMLISSIKTKKKNLGIKAISLLFIVASCLKLFLF